MKTIPVKLLKEFYRAKTEGDIVRTYIDKNPLVRWIYWGRLKRMLNIGEKCRGTRVLDLGCGEGVFLPALSENFERVYGLDIDIRVAREVVGYYDLKNVHLLGIDLFDNSFDDDFFDIIFAPSTLEHFSDMDKLFAEILRLISPDGHLIASCPTETGFYRLGRNVFGYEKPDDHYFSAAEIAGAGRRYLRLVSKKYGPFAALPVFAAYCIYVFKKQYQAR